MISQIPNETPYDLRWSLWGVECRVHPLFWVMALLLGWPYLDQGAEFLLAWVLTVFISVLVHEAGHATMAALFGERSAIYLHGMGGVTVSQVASRRALPDILISLAGPGAGFGLYFLVRYGLDYLPAEELSPAGGAMLSMLLTVNLFWGLLNLLPVLRLDGGRVVLRLLALLWPRHGARLAAFISLVTAVLLTINFFLAKAIFAAVFFAVFAFDSLRALGWVRE